MIINDYAAGKRMKNCQPLRHAVLGLERKILLCEVAERHYDYSGQDLGNRGVYMQVLNEKLNKDIVQEHTHHNQQKVPEQLNSAA
jgi:hypothetical protein